MLRGGAALLASTVLLDAAASAAAPVDDDAFGSERAVELDRYEVSETTTDGLAPASTRAAIAALATVSGGASLVERSDFLGGRTASIADALRFQAGVTAQSAVGGEAVRLTLRGSGLVRGPTAFGQGVQVLFDGQPLASATGNPYESTEPLFAHYIEVLRGANSFKFGPLSLGGAVNYVTLTGYDAPGLRLRAEYGSDHYQRGFLSYGASDGTWDYFVGVARFQSDGFRDNAESSSTRAVFHAGYRLGDRVSTRLNVRFAEQRQQGPGNLTYAQLLADSRQAQTPAIITTRHNRGSTTVSSVTKVLVGESSSFTAGLQFKDYPITNLGGPTPSDFDFKDVTTDLTFEDRREVFGGRAHRAAVSLKYALQIDSGTTGTNAAGVRTYATGYDGYDLLLQAQDELQVGDRLWLDLGVAGIWQRRDTEIRYANAAVTDPRRVSDYTHVAPRAGVRFDLTPAASLYANYSRSLEAPITINYTRSIGGVHRSTIPLDAQQADTVEIGTRGRAGRFEWDLSIYRSWVEDELLSVNITPGSPTATVLTSNASPTIHQGVEAALDTVLYASPGAEPAHELRLRQGYTFNDFFFEGDSTFKKNELAGVYRQLYQAELSYRFGGGFTIAADLERAPVSSPADFANTIFARPYTIYGARVAYAPRSAAWSVFLDGRNLGDERYAAVFAPFYDAAGLDRAVYSPGVGRNFTVGASLKF